MEGEHSGIVVPPPSRSSGCVLCVGEAGQLCWHLRMHIRPPGLTVEKVIHFLQSFLVTLHICLGHKPSCPANESPVNFLSPGSTATTQHHKRTGLSSLGCGRRLIVASSCSPFLSTFLPVSGLRSGRGSPCQSWCLAGSRNGLRSGALATVEFDFLFFLLTIL